MSREPEIQSRASDEAAQWFARLNGTSISTAELAEFQAWRRHPQNDLAYIAIEGLWKGSAPLRAEPEMQAALLAAQRRGTPRGVRLWWRQLGLLTGLGAVALAGLAVVAVFVASPGRTYQTAIGEQSTIALEDGTRVRLDTDTRLAVRFTPRERLITLLRGQAFFDVVHQAQRPLRVKVGETLIQDLGTRFDVRKDAAQVRITVLEGSVQVGGSARTPAWTLVAGQQMLAGRAPHAPYPVDPAKATSWTSGRLVFDEISLSVATAEMNRYGQHKLILRAGGLGEIKVNGAFDSTDTAAFVAAVTRLYELKAEPQPDGSIVLLPTPPLNESGEKNKS